MSVADVRLLQPKSAVVSRFPETVVPLQKFCESLNSQEAQAVALTEEPPVPTTPPVAGAPAAPPAVPPVPTTPPVAGAPAAPPAVPPVPAEAPTQVTCRVTVALHLPSLIVRVIGCTPAVVQV